MITISNSFGRDSFWVNNSKSFDALHFFVYEARYWKYTAGIIIIISSFL